MKGREGGRGGGRGGREKESGWEGEGRRRKANKETMYEKKPRKGTGKVGRKEGRR